MFQYQHLCCIYLFYRTLQLDPFTNLHITYALTQFNNLHITCPPENFNIFWDFDLAIRTITLWVDSSEIIVRIDIQDIYKKQRLTLRHLIVYDLKNILFFIFDLFHDVFYLYLIFRQCSAKTIMPTFRGDFLKQKHRNITNIFKHVKWQYIWKILLTYFKLFV